LSGWPLALGPGCLLRPLFGPQRGLLPDLLGVEGLQAHDFQSARHSQLEDRLPRAARPFSLAPSP